MGFKIQFLVFGAAALLLCSSVFSAENSLTVKDRSGSATANFPLQIGRPFWTGEIPQYPQALVNGSPVATQADVKTRYGDGSVKHAILTFLIPTLPANGSVKITFQNQSTGNNTGLLDQAGMLDSRFNFDAVMQLVNGSTQTASARTMLNAGAFTYWLQGSVATSVVLADHSLARVYDMGFDSHRAIRPIFHATFWPAINKVRVRFIGEISNTEAFEDQTYSVTLKTGASSPATVYTQGSFTHSAGARWTKEVWIGGAPAAVDINHNLAWLAKTRCLPNYDTTKVVPASDVTSAYTGWQGASKIFFGQGNWTKAMGTTGGREDIGPYPTWTLLWLYTGDDRMREKAFGNADLASAWPIQFREGNATKKFNRGDTLSGLGRVLSVTSRPTIDLFDIPYQYTLPADRVVPVGNYTASGWDPDNAHIPDPYSPQYALSGDYFYLEQLYFWSSWSCAKMNGAAYMYSYGRGPTGAEGGISDQMRGMAWTLRSRSQTAFFAPDGSPEKKYFTTLIDDAAAEWEGGRNITGTSFYQNANWNWAHQLQLPALGVPTLHHWVEGDPGFVQDPMDAAVVKEATSTWEQNFMMFALGRALELGFPFKALVSYLAVNIVGQLTDPGYNPYLIAAYRIPTVRLSDGKYFDTWANLKTGYQTASSNPTSFSLSDGDHGYDFIALTAAAQCANEPGGAAAWAFISSKALSSPILSSNPKWAIVPRKDTLSMAVQVSASLSLPAFLSLFPNPGRNSVSFRWGTAAVREIKIYDAAGKVVAKFLPGRGRHELVWNSRSFSNGIYIVRTVAGDRTLSKRLVLLK